MAPEHQVVRGVEGEEQPGQHILLNPPAHLLPPLLNLLFPLHQGDQGGDDDLHLLGGEGEGARGAGPGGGGEKWGEGEQGGEAGRAEEGGEVAPQLTGGGAAGAGAREGEQGDPGHGAQLLTPGQLTGGRWQVAPVGHSKRLASRDRCAEANPHVAFLHPPPEVQEQEQDQEHLEFGAQERCRRESIGKRPMSPGPAGSWWER